MPDSRALRSLISADAYWACRCVIDVAAADAERAKQTLQQLDCCYTLGETPVMRLIREGVEEAREVHTWSRLSVVGTAENNHEFRLECLRALRKADIEAWLEG